jgi:hypothetical protein
MTDAFRGLYRTIDGAYVTNGMMAFHVPEADYRAFGYEPDFDSLPWKESYNAAKETEHAHAALTDADNAPDQWKKRPLGPNPDSSRGRGKPARLSC